MADNPIIAVEDHIVAIAKAMLGTHVGTVEPLPSALTAPVLKKLIAANKSPGIYPVFLGGGAATQDRINARFDVFVIVKNAAGHIARRRGDSTLAGSYQLVSGLVPKLHDTTVPGVGTLKLKRVQNLFSMVIEESFNAALYAISFEMPNMPFPDDIDTSALNDWLTYHGEHSLVPGDDEPAAIDEVTLEQ